MQLRLNLDPPWMLQVCISDSFMNIMQRQFGPESQRREPRESLGQYSPGYRKNSLGDQEKSLGETSPGDQETFLRVFPPGDYFFVTKRNFLVYFLHALVPHPHQVGSLGLTVRILLVTKKNLLVKLLLVTKRHFFVSSHQEIISW